MPAKQKLMRYIPEQLVPLLPKVSLYLSAPTDYDIYILQRVFRAWLNTATAKKITIYTQIKFSP
jgi:hypothetical protein